MKRLRREEGLGQSTWEPDIMKGPKGGSSRRKSRGSETGRRKMRSSDAATQRRDGFGLAGRLSAPASGVSGGPAGC